MTRLATALACCLALASRAGSAPPSYVQLVQRDAPLVVWRFDDSTSGEKQDGKALAGRVIGSVQRNVAGPRSDRFPLFDDVNRAVRFSGQRGFIRVADPGKGSLLDFDKGDTITLEAWVKVDRIANGRHQYVIGKGRTKNPGFPAENQNYALRLTGAGGEAKISFLFRSARNRKDAEADYHRWTSTGGFAPGRWHYVAVSYTFGKADSLAGYIDGQPVRGKWDMGGATNNAPVVDDDELWIGSSLGGHPNSTFQGSIDEVAIYRKALSKESIAVRYRAIRPKPYVTNVPIPSGRVLVEIQEGVPARNSWDFVATKPAERYDVPAFCFNDVPHKYSARGLRIARSNPFILRCTGYVELPKGKHQFLLRSRSAARLYVDGKLVVQTPFHTINGGGHVAVRRASKIKLPNLRPLATGDSEELAVFSSPGKRHRVRLELFVGGKSKRMEPGEALAAIRPDGRDSMFKLLAPQVDISLTNDEWIEYADASRAQLIALNAANRKKASATETAWWKHRHEFVRRELARSSDLPVPKSPTDAPASNAIDRFIDAKLREVQVQPQPVIDDWAFLRRVTLDVIGTVPTPEQIESFFADKRPDRRARYIDRLLEHPGWADHWTSYWQDVLAENPNILKPTLNNTGPFRFWIWESLYDNKPLDRFVTELIRMEGDQYLGAPAGFGVAKQNDAPMAAKAHVLGQAFLAVQMKCARCHDAPFHDLKQRDLFEIAAMLRRGPQPVPMTSSIPLSDEALESLIVKVTLKPGSQVKPAWPFPEIVKPGLPKELLKNSSDSRERLAALIVSPGNKRFARVMVNRVWQRYMGLGLVEPVDDWETAQPSNPALLDWLAREFVVSGYDLKHVARLILQSRAYRRRPIDVAQISSQAGYYFPGPIRRRLAAEQFVDSLFVVAGKRLNAGILSMDLDGARPYSTFLNLGRPRRAWEFISLSNERDRPSLALPFAQDFVSLLKAFGWRASRQDPRTIREQDPTVLQPAIVSNGVIARRITRLSDDGALTELALADQTVEQLVDRIYQRVLTRNPTAAERATFVELLRPGYEKRAIAVDPKSVVKHPPRVNRVSWTNHLRAEANRLKIEMEHVVQQGDRPSVRLDTQWRERAEDMLWSLINTPEFAFVP